MLNIVSNLLRAIRIGADTVNIITKMDMKMLAKQDLILLILYQRI